MDRPEQIAEAWRAAFAADGPVVIQAETDPDVPPLPPHVNWEQARHYLSALAGGDTDRAGVVRQTARQVLAGLFGAED